MSDAWVVKEDEELAATPFDMEGGKSRLGRWESEFTKTLMIGGFVFLAAYAIPIILDGLHPEIRRFCDVVVIVLWIAFAIDFIMRFILAKNKGDFLKHNIFDLITLGIPMLRPLRALTVIQRFTQWASSSLRGKWLTYVIFAMVLLVLVGSLAVVDAERANPEANIITWPRGLLWAFEAVTDVGFSEYDPVTPLGNIIGVLLQLTGLALMGFIIAWISSWFMENLAEQLHDKKAPSTVGQVEQLEDMGKEINKEVTDLDKELLEALRAIPIDTLKQLGTSQPSPQSVTP